MFDKSHDISFYYQLLNRLVQDCKYFLGCGNRCEKHLWGKNVKNHIETMKEVYNHLKEKPEWLTFSEIEMYEQKMQ